jgi:predicted O-methyltransferase YrrM
MLAKAAPLAGIISLTTSAAEAREAEAFWRLQGIRNAHVFPMASWEFLSGGLDPVSTLADSDLVDMVFVDGDHNQIARDLPWFNRLRKGGLLLCHDYSPQDSRTPSAIVYAELNAMAEKLGRPFDVRIVDEGKVGMVGFCRREEESWA